MLLTRTTLFLNNPQLLTIQYAKTVPPTTEKKSHSIIIKIPIREKDF